MKQLGILDSAFINLEHPNTPQQIGGLGIYDPSTAPGEFVRFKDVLKNFEQRLARMPVFRTRLVEVPGGIDRPYWVTDDKFDVEYHIRHIALPEPGDWRQLCIQVARLHSRPLDMSIPLWECYIIEGLDNIPDLPPGSFAVYTKMHHSLVDGAGGQSFMAALHDLEPAPAVDPVKSPMEIEYRYPPLGAAEMIGRAVFNRARNAVPNARGLWNAARGFADTALRMYHSELPPLPMDAPRTRFDNPVGPHRVFDASIYALADFKAMKNATGTTLNDCWMHFLSIYTGSLNDRLLQYWRSQGTAVPVFAGDLWWGFLRFDRHTAAASWADVEIEALRAAAGIIGWVGLVVPHLARVLVGPSFARLLRHVILVIRVRHSR